MNHLTPSAIVEPCNGALIVYVEYPWAGVDRPRTMGWNVGADSPRARRLAGRLSRAIEAGAATGPGTVLTDINGRTYVGARSNVLGRVLNADLRRLGY